MADHVVRLKEVPKGQRLQYIWDYYRYPALIAVIVAVVVISLIKAIFFQTKPDATVLMTTNLYVDQQTIQQMRSDLTSLTGDVNGDGETEVLFSYIPYNSERDDPQTFMTMSQKLMAELSTAQSMLQIVDDYMFEYLKIQELVATYSELVPYGYTPDAPDADIKIPLKSLQVFSGEAYQDLPDNLYLTLRPKEASQLSDSASKHAYYDSQVNLLLSWMAQ